MLVVLVMLVGLALLVAPVVLGIIWGSSRTTGNGTTSSSTSSSSSTATSSASSATCGTSSVVH